jgi:hypothetical protein
MLMMQVCDTVQGEGIKPMSRTLTIGAAACLAITVGFGVAPSANASSMTFSGSSGSLASSATFHSSGTNLIITLVNTSTHDVLVPADVLTGVFFDVNSSLLSLTRASAVLPTGSSVLFGTTDPGNVVGGEWAYRSGLLGPAGTAYGISSSGLGLFGPGDRFPGTNLQGPTDPDGLQYGITSAGDNPATGNTPVTGTNALIKNSVEFMLSGIPAGFDPSTAIYNVHFQYGTALSDPLLHSPEPATLILLACGAVVAFRRR